ncbi:MAG TPA: outer membrane protein transport protein [Kofleriaceae bacterium]|jgi:long-subunit fatty acid transport protein
MRRLAFALTTLLAGHAAVAGGFGIPEIGVRRTAMGSIIGRPDDPSAIYHNPGGLILEPGWNLYVSAGLSLLDTSFSLAPWDQSSKYIQQTPGPDGYYAPVKPSRAFGVIPMIAATYEVLPDRLVVGVGVFVGNAQGAKFSSTAVTHYHLIDGYVVAPQAVASASYRVAPWLSVGASVGVLNVRIHGERNVFPVVNGADVSNLVGTNPLLKLDGSGWAPTWMVGLFGQPTKWLTWGATVTGRVECNMSGPIELRYSDDAFAPGDLKGSQKSQQFLPWSFTGGANVDLTPHVEVGFDFRYWLYRQFQNAHTDITGIFLIRTLDTPKDYHDSQEISGGVRVHDLAFAPKLDLMAGLQYDHSPAPPETVSLDSPSFSHVGVHSGARYTFGRYRVGFSYIHYWYDVPTITDSITAPPTNIKGHGSNNIMTASLEVRL